jgi:hypothetical protein
LSSTEAQYLLESSDLENSKQEVSWDLWQAVSSHWRTRTFQPMPQAFFLQENWWLSWAVIRLQGETIASQVSKGMDATFSYSWIGFWGRY